MFTEKIANAPWHEILTVLSTGDPPMAVRLLAVNTVFFAIFIWRKAKAKHKVRTTTAYMIQASLILMNSAVLFQDQFVIWFRMAKHAI